jgi:hypothetical protein
MNRKVPVRFGGGRLEKCLYSTSNSLAAYPVDVPARLSVVVAGLRADLRSALQKRMTPTC